MSSMLSARIKTVVLDVTYKDWGFRVEPMGDGCYVQATFLADSTWQHGRKWYISPHACKSEIVQTLLMAVLAAEEHEAREQFLYRGAPIFGPHKDVDALLDVRHQTRG